MEDNEEGWKMVLEGFPKCGYGGRRSSQEEWSFKEEGLTCDTYFPDLQ